MIPTTKRSMARVAAFLAVLAVAFLSGGVAEATQPQAWEVYLQPANTDVHEHIHWFANFTMWIMGAVVLFVLGLLIYVMVKFNAKANPVPSKTSHNTLIEVIWTVVPVMILVMIAIPSFRLLYEEMVVPPADMTIKVTGYQWYWGYEYSDLMDAKNRPLSFDSTVVRDEDRKDPVKQPRLLAVDNNLVVPVGKIVRVQVTGADVIHSWAMPSFGVKMDGNPGRLNETWFKARNTGMYYGQCSELCGRDHAFMPIAIQVVTEEQFKAWSEAAKTNLDAATKLLAEMTERDAAKTAVAAN